MATPTLAEVLTTHKLRDAFLKFAEAQHAEENFLFYLDVESYRRLTSPSELVHHSRLIVEKYLMVGSQYELCAPNALKSKILDRLSHPTPTTFDELGDVIYNWTLTEMHHKFLTSNQYYAAIGRPQSMRMSMRVSASSLPTPAPLPAPSSPLAFSAPSSSSQPKPPSLEEVFATPNLREAFHRFAESQHAEENFLFWTEVEAYREIDGAEERQEKAKKIVDRFLVMGSLYELSAPDETKQKIMEKRERGADRTTFDPLRDVIFQWTLVDLHLKFLASSQYLHAMGISVSPRSIASPASPVITSRPLSPISPPLIPPLSPSKGSLSPTPHRKDRNALSPAPGRKERERATSPTGKRSLPSSPPTLEAVLASNSLRDAFHAFAVAQLNEENFLFWKEVTEFRLLIEPSQIVDRARHIANKYVVTGAEYELSAPDEIKQSIQSRIANPNKEMFDDLYTLVYQWTLPEMYHKFLTSPQYLEGSVSPPRAAARQPPPSFVPAYPSHHQAFSSYLPFPRTNTLAISVDQKHSTDRSEKRKAVVVTSRHTRHGSVELKGGIKVGERAGGEGEGTVAGGKAEIGSRGGVEGGLSLPPKSVREPSPSHLPPPSTPSAPSSSQSKVPAASYTFSPNLATAPAPAPLPPLLPPLAPTTPNRAISPVPASNPALPPAPSPGHAPSSISTSGSMISITPHGSKNDTLLDRFFNKKSKTDEEKEKERERKEEEEYAKELKRRKKERLLKQMKDNEMRPKDENIRHSGLFATVADEREREKKNYKFIVRSVYDLPHDVHESIERMGISYEIIEANLGTFLNVLSFADKHIPKRKFFTEAQLADFQQKHQRFARPNLGPRILLSSSDAFEKCAFSDARKQYRMGQFLGVGGFGQVVSATRKVKSGDSVVALKIQMNESDKQKSMNLEEVSLMRFCDHPNIIKLFGALEVRSEVWLVMELLQGGSLKLASTSEGERFSESEIAYVAREMLNGICYLHDKGIAHRDLKNMNVMLSVDGSIRLIDLGLAVDMSEGPRYGMVGSPLWMAPEMIRGDIYTYSVDIWSFCVCMCELANQHPPNRENIKRAMFLTATVGLARFFDEPELWSKSFESFLHWGSVFDPSDRPTAVSLLSHPFLNCACDKKNIKDKLQAIFVDDNLKVFV